MMHKALLLIVAITLISNNIAWASASPTTDTRSGTAYEQVMKEFDDYVTELEKLRSFIDRTQFDLDALLDDLDYQAESIISFVQNEIYYQQYSGSLRGAEGTLMSRAGNALDQSILLAKLLHDAGYDARIAEGTIPEATAMQLVREYLPLQLQALRNSREKRVSSTEEELLRSLVTPNNSEPFDPTIARVDITTMSDYQQMMEISEDLISRFSEGQRRNPTSEFERKLVKEAAEYYWVETRSGASDPWQPIHVFGSDLIDPDNIVVSSYLYDSVPERLTHRVGIEIINEQKLGDKIIERPVIDPWVRPAASLHGSLLTYSNAPIQFSTGDAVLNPEEMLSSSKIFAPMLNSGPAPGGQFFDMEGNNIDPLAAGSPAAGVFAEVSKRFGEAAGAVENGRNPEDFVAFVGQKIRITFYSPDGTKDIRERTVLDNRAYADASVAGGTNDVGKSRSDQIYDLTRIRTLSFNSGYIPDDFILDRTINRMRDSRRQLEIVARKVLNPNEPVVVSPGEISKIETGWLGAYFTYSAFDADLHFGTSYSYRSVPNLLMRHAPITPSGGQPAVDVVKNERRVLSLIGGQVRQSFDDSVRVGVWETLNEGFLNGPDQSALNTLRVFVEARSESIPVRHISPERLSIVDELQISEQAKMYAKRDLAAGNHLVIPERTPSTLERVGWWRVNPQDGTTLGMLDTGEGTDIPEELEVKVLVAGTVLGLSVFAVCMVRQEYTREHSQLDETTFDMRQWGECLGLGAAAGTAVTGAGMVVVATGAALLSKVGAVLAAGLGLISGGLVFEASMRERSGE